MNSLIQLVQLEKILVKKEIIPGLDVWFGSLDQPIWITNRITKCLSFDEVERAKQFLFQSDQTRYMVSRGLLRWILGQYTNNCPENIMFNYSLYGKPYLNEVQSRGISFNLSHSHNYVCIAVGNSKVVGVDIEFENHSFNFVPIIECIFTDREKQALLKFEYSKRRAFFYETWVRKEALVKGIGKGLSHPLQSFDVLESHVGIKDENNLLKKWVIKSLDIHPCYKAAVCYRENKQNYEG